MCTHFFFRFMTVLLVANTTAFTTTTAATGGSSRGSIFGSTVTSNKLSSMPLRASSMTPPTWDELEATLEKKKVECNNMDGIETMKPLVTLYRDTNGWCPFCERVWLALRVKGILYEEQLINLQDKPSWFTQMVPTGLVPAVLIHNDMMLDENDKMKNEDENEETNIKPQPQRALIWESLDIMKALDEKFPETQRLVFDDDPKYLQAREVVSKVSQAGFKFVYGGRNESLSVEEKLERKQNFTSALDDLDSFLKRDGNDGPFLLGGKPTGVDIEIVPSLERWRYQLPLTSMIDISEGRSGITAWFAAMDAFEPYAGRVAGDKYSWTAVASTFLRIFSIGGKDLTPDEAAAVSRADAAAEAMRKDFATTVDEAGGSENKAQHALEAASKLISNRDAVIADCTRAEPLSQKDLARAKNPDFADLALRSAIQALLAGEDVVTPDFGVSDSSAPKDAALAVRTVAARLCVPRDMGAPAAKTLRSVLERTALAIEETVAPAAKAKDEEAVKV